MVGQGQPRGRRDGPALSMSRCHTAERVRKVEADFFALSANYSTAAASPFTFAPHVLRADLSRPHSVSTSACIRPLSGRATGAAQGAVRLGGSGGLGLALGEAAHAVSAKSGAACHRVRTCRIFQLLCQFVRFGLCRQPLGFGP